MGLVGVEEQGFHDPWLGERRREEAKGIRASQSVEFA